MPRYHATLPDRLGRSPFWNKAYVMISLPRHHIFFHLSYNLFSFKINITFFKQLLYKTLKRYLVKIAPFFFFLLKRLILSHQDYKVLGHGVPEAEEALQVEYVKSSVVFDKSGVFEKRARSTPHKTVLVDDTCLSPNVSCSPRNGAEQSVCDVVRQFNQGWGLKYWNIFKLSVLQDHGIDFFLKFVNNDFLYASLGALT